MQPSQKGSCFFCCPVLYYCYFELWCLLNWESSNLSGNQTVKDAKQFFTAHNSNKKSSPFEIFHTVIHTPILCLLYSRMGVHKTKGISDLIDVMKSSVYNTPISAKYKWPGPYFSKSTTFQYRFLTFFCNDSGSTSTLSKRMKQPCHFCRPEGSSSQTRVHKHEPIQFCHLCLSCP